MAEETPRLYLTDVQLKGYKSIKDTKATFNEGINIIIGPNGSGKTNFLEFLVKALEQKIVQGTTYGRSDINYEIILNAAKHKLGILTEYTVYEDFGYSENGNRDDIEFIRVENGNLSFDGKELMKVENENYRNWQEYEALLDSNAAAHFSNDSYEFELIDAIYGALDGYNANYLRFELAESISMLSKPNSIFFRNRPSGKFAIRFTGYKNALVFLISHVIHKEKVPITIETGDLDKLIHTKFSEYYSVSFKEIVSTYSPISDVRISAKTLYTKNTDGINFDFFVFEFQIGSDWFLWQQLSDGTKRAFAIVLQILDTNFGPILLEEPELGLYPDQLQKLLTFIKEQSSRLQFIITTHSPDVLDVLGIDELDKINICEMKGEEGTKIRKMNANERKGAETYYKNTGFLSDYWKHQNLGMK